MTILQNSADLRLKRVKVSSEARDTDSVLSESNQHEDGDYVSSILEIITISYCCERFFNLAYQMLFALFLLIVLSCSNWDPALNSLPFYNLQCDHTNWGHPDRKWDKFWNEPTTSRDLNNEIVLILYSVTLRTSQGYYKESWRLCKPGWKMFWQRLGWPEHSISQRWRKFEQSELDPFNNGLFEQIKGTVYPITAHVPNIDFLFCREFKSHERRVSEPCKEIRLHRAWPSSILN